VTGEAEVTSGGGAATVSRPGDHGRGGHGRAGHDRAGHDQADDDRAGHDQADDDLADDRAGHDLAGHDQAGQQRPGGPRRSRLVDIAEAVGVHVSTVSRVLNGDPAQSVRPEVYERILDTARQQGYRPNALARALKRRRTGALALVVPLLRNPIWARLQRGALQRARDRGYVVMIMEEPTEDPRPPADYGYLVDESRADGLLLATALRIAEHAGGVNGPPHVYINRRGPDRGHDVVMDEPRAVRLFLDDAVALGHRSFALVDGPPEVDTVFRRVGAARRACAERGLSLAVRHAAPTEDGGWDATTRLLRRRPRPTVCGVGSLNQVFGVLAALRDAGVEVPGEMSVVSFDEDECLAFLAVPVTSVSMPLSELGAAAVDALIARIEGAPAGDVMVREPMSVMRRGSVARAPRLS
jgi:LacI family transcriptional regulator